MVSATPIDLPENLDAAGAVELLPAANGRGHLLVGWSTAERAPSSPRIWESLDGLAWAPAAAPVSLDESTITTVSDATWAGTTLAVGGGTNTLGAGPRAAMWLAPDGVTFGVPEFPLGQRASGVGAVAATDVGLVVAGWLDDGTEDTTFVAVRAADGTWRRATVPTLPDFAVAGIAAIGSTIVVTGSDTAPDPQVAAALVSTDGGATFVSSDVSSFAGGFDGALGPVEASPGGFVAVACAPYDVGWVTALARSTDGITWVRQDVQVVGGDFDRLDLRYAGCSNLELDGDRALVGITSFSSGVVLDIDPAGAATALRTAERGNEVASAGPYVAPTPFGTVVVANEIDGLTPSILESGELGAGLPPGSPRLQQLRIQTFDTTAVLEVVMYPTVDRDGTYGPYRRWLQADEGRSFETAPWPRELYLATTAPFGALGLATAPDSGDVVNPVGPISGTEALALDERNRWRSLDLVLSGPGGDYIDDVTPFGPGVVAVGTSTFRDPATLTQTSTPVALSSVDGATWSTEQVPLPPGATGWLDWVCALPDRVVGFGGQLLDGVESEIVAIRDALGAWSVTAPVGIQAATDLGACVSNGTTLLVTGSDDDRSAVFSSTDGVNFAAADLSGAAFDDTSFNDIATTPGGFVAIGTRSGSDRDVNGAVWTSPDGLVWTEVQLDGMDGLGPQTPVSVALWTDGSLLIAGYDLGAPVVWTVPPGVVP